MQSYSRMVFGIAISKIDSIEKMHLLKRSNVNSWCYVAGGTEFNEPAVDGVLREFNADT